MTHSNLIPLSSHVHLKQYKYAAVDQSFLSKYILQHYWNWVAQWFPLWMAPNLITFIGFCFIVFNTLLTIYYSPELLNNVPSYCCYIYGIGIFIYQTLDAIDGKQARRTGQSGPLGHLFDHGCDALNTTLTIISIAPMLGIGGSPLLLLALFSTLGNFYLTTWEEYNTGVLYLGVFSGPVEGVLLVAAMSMATGYFGAEMLQTPLPLIHNYTLSQVFVGSGLLFILFNCANSFWNVYRKGKQPYAFLGLLPFFIFSFLIYVWCHVSSAVLHHSSTPLCLYITFAFGHMVGKMILAHILKTSFPMFNLNWIPVVLAILPTALQSFVSIQLSLFSPANVHLYVWICALFSCWTYFSFTFRVIKEICDILDIWCLTIKHPVAKKQS